MLHESALREGLRIDEYEIFRVLGAGGFGITYLGYDHNLDKAVAIKEYLPNDIAVRKGEVNVVPKTLTDKSDYEWGLDRFLDEARVLARLDHHNLPKVYRFFSAFGTAYIFMEYIDGMTLSQMFKLKGNYDEQSLRDLLLPLLDGLEAVHEAGYLHRDIKPANIMVRDDGSPVLLDFGSARQALGAQSRRITTIITPGYAPIEQYSSKGNLGVWSDLYALAAVSYKGLSGITPSDATERIRDDPLKPLTEYGVNGVSDQFLTAIEWGLRVHEADRPQNIEEWREALIKDSAVPATKTLEDFKDRKPKTGKSSNRQLAIAGGVFLAILAVGATWFLYQPIKSLLFNSDITTPVIDSTPSPEEQTAWDSALARDLPKDFWKFINDYPRSTYVDKAKKKMEDLEEGYWKNEVQVRNEKEGYEEYLELYPNGLWAGIAQIRSGN